MSALEAEPFESHLTKPGSQPVSSDGPGLCLGPLSWLPGSRPLEGDAKSGDQVIDLQMEDSGFRGCRRGACWPHRAWRPGPGRRALGSRMEGQRAGEQPSVSYLGMFPKNMPILGPVHGARD